MACDASSPARLPSGAKHSGQELSCSVNMLDCVSMHLCGTTNVNGHHLPLQVRFEDTGKFVQARITVPADRCSAAAAARLKSLRKKVKVKGFRQKSKVPDERIIEEIGGIKEFNKKCMEVVMEDAIQEACIPTALTVVLSSRTWACYGTWHGGPCSGCTCHVCTVSVMTVNSPKHGLAVSTADCTGCMLLQAMQQYASDLIDGSLAVVEGADQLTQGFDPTKDFTFTCRAERGSVGLKFHKSYVGMPVKVTAVFNEAEEDFEFRRTMLKCDLCSLLFISVPL